MLTDWVSYIKSRGVNEETIRKFDIFFKDDLGNVHGLTNIVDNPCACDLGSIYKNSIIFPIKDFNGHLKCLSARKFNNGLKFYFPKGFKKKELLFGLNVTKYDIIKKGFVYIVEGYFDLLTLYSHGIKNVVCCMGSVVTTDQILQLLLLTDRFVVVFDPDAGGASGCTDLTRKKKIFNFKLKKLTMPEKMDPDEFILKYGYLGWNNFLKTLQELV